jgi:hypothetical protein
MGGKSPGTQTTTTQENKQAPAYVQQAQQNLLNQGGNILQPFLNQPAYAIAGQNPDQQQAFDYARQIAVNAFPQGGSGVPQISGMTDAAKAQFTPGTASQLGPSDYKPFLNEYTQDVVNTSLANMRRQNNDTQAQIGAKAAAAGAFGGSREALMRGQQNRAFGEQAAGTVAQLMAQGFDKAQALALANAQMKQQTGMQNTSIQNQMATSNAGLAQNARQFNADYGIKAAQTNSGLQDAEQARQLKALQALLGSGNQQQQFGQQIVDLPFSTLQKLAAITPQDNSMSGTSTKQSPDNSPSPLQQLLGVGLTIGGMGMPGGGSLLGSLFRR